MKIALLFIKTNREIIFHESNEEERTMKRYYTWILPIFIGSMLSAPPTWAQDKNLCDEYYESGFSAEIVEKCQELHGVSDWYNKEIEAIAKKEAEKEKERKEREALQEAISEKTFDRSMLKQELGFGALDLIAYQIVISYGQNYRVTGEKREQLTSADRACRELGFEKATKAVINPEEINGEKLSGKAHYFTSERKGSIFNRRNEDVVKAWRWSHNDKKGKMVQLFSEITCIKSDIENNELLEQVTFVEKMLTDPVEVEVGNIQRSTADTRVNDSPRFARPESPDRVQENLLNYFDRKSEDR